MASEEFVDIGGGAFPGTHGTDDGSGPGNDITPGPDPVFVRLASLFVSDNRTPAGSIQPFSC